VFQEQLITGERGDDRSSKIDTTLTDNDLGWMETQLGPMVDLQQLSVFEEPFYIVVLERAGKGSSATIVHMWRLVIASQPDHTGERLSTQTERGRVMRFAYAFSWYPLRSDETFLLQS